MFQQIRAIRLIRCSSRAVAVVRDLFVLLFMFLTNSSHAQTIQILTTGTKTSIRGLSVVNNNILWTSGSNGTIARSTDGGKTFNWITVKGYEQRDFRDIEAFDSNTAIIMAVAEPALILKTIDAGKSWKKVFEDTTKGMFLDAMDFAGNIGVVIGDPVNSKAFLALTEDSGNHWNAASSQYTLNTGEAFFASSGTNIKLSLDSFERIYDQIAVSGGLTSNLLIGKKYKLPLLQGKESQGANSLAINPINKNLIIVGGDFKNDKNSKGNCVLISFHRKIHIKVPQTPPHGYRSCVEYINNNQLITCGTSGVDISNDDGMNWSLISPESFHVCQKAKQGNSVFLAGKDGRIAKLIF